MPSTAIRRFDYDPQTRTLYVTFVSGQDYASDDVPPGLVRAFRAAPYRGRLFLARVRDRYALRRLDPTNAPLLNNNLLNLRRKSENRP